MKYRDAGKPEHVRAILAYCYLLFFVAVFFTIVFANIDGAVRDIAMVLVGALVAKSEKVDQFFFGSSQGSKDKSDAMNHDATGKPNDPVHVEED